MAHVHSRASTQGCTCIEVCVSFGRLVLGSPAPQLPAWHLLAMQEPPCTSGVLIPLHTQMRCCHSTSSIGPPHLPVYAVLQRFMLPPQLHILPLSIFCLLRGVQRVLCVSCAFLHATCVVCVLRACLFHCWQVPVSGLSHCPSLWAAHLHTAVGGARPATQPPPPMTATVTAAVLCVHRPAAAPAAKCCRRLLRAAHTLHSTPAHLSNRLAFRLERGFHFLQQLCSQEAQVTAQSSITRVTNQSFQTASGGCCLPCLVPAGMPACLPGHSLLLPSAAGI